MTVEGREVFQRGQKMKWRKDWIVGDGLGRGEDVEDEKESSYSQYCFFSPLKLKKKLVRKVKQCIFGKYLQYIKLD